MRQIVIVTVRPLSVCPWLFVSPLSVSLWLFVSPLSVSLWLFVHFRIAVWPSAGKELTSWLSAYAVLLNVVLIVCAPFPFGIWDRMWNSIVTVPDHCIFICFCVVSRRSWNRQMAELELGYKQGLKKYRETNLILSLI